MKCYINETHSRKRQFVDYNTSYTAFNAHVSYRSLWVKQCMIHKIFLLFHEFHEGYMLLSMESQISDWSQCVSFLKVFLSGVHFNNSSQKAGWCIFNRVGTDSTVKCLVDFLSGSDWSWFISALVRTVVKKVQNTFTSNICFGAN